MEKGPNLSGYVSNRRKRPEKRKYEIYRFHFTGSDHRNYIVVTDRGDPYLTDAWEDFFLRGRGTGGGIPGTGTETFQNDPV